MPNKCFSCGITFNKWEDYAEHRIIGHKHTTEVKPIRTTKRTKAEIVKDFERMYSEWFI